MRYNSIEYKHKGQRTAKFSTLWGIFGKGGKELIY